MQLFLRTSFLPVEEIRIFLGGINISDHIASLKNLSSKLSKLWTPGDNGHTSLVEKEAINVVEKRLAA